MLLNMEDTVCTEPARKGDAGFSLIELMAVIAIFAILAIMALGDWGDVRTLTQIESAVEEVKSAMASARLKARATGRNQTVTFNYTAGTMVSSVMPGTKDYSNIANIAAFSCSSSCSVVSGTTSKTFTFTSRGTGTNATFRIQSKDGSVVRYITVSNVAGRVKVATKCASNTCS